MEKNKHSLAFWLCLLSSIALFIGGFFVPPTGVIDGSVITCAGILFGFATLGQIPVIIETAGHAKITQGNMTIEVGKKHKGIYDTKRREESPDGRFAEEQRYPPSDMDGVGEEN